MPDWVWRSFSELTADELYDIFVLRQTVFVDRGNGFLEPRQVQIGRQFGNEIEILGGLKSGERIVTSGTFLIDAESQLQSAGAQQ